MSHPHIDQFFEQLRAVWPADAGRDAALAELRDHLLTVYEAELDAGALPAAAAEAALAEGGDAWQLRANFRGASYLRRGRWIMRLTTAALVAGILVTGSVAIWWPGERAAPLAVATLQAQQGLPPTVRKVETPTGGDPTEANNAATSKKLATYLTAEFVEAPLSEVLDYIRTATEVETYVNAKQLAEVDVALDAPISIQLKRVRADMLLDLTLQQAGSSIDYVVRDGIVVITTVESLEGASEVKAYPVADVLKIHADRELELGGVAAPGGPGIAPGFQGGGGFGGGGGPGGAFPGSGRLPESVEQLIAVITNSVAPDSWQYGGGHGTIVYYGEMLVIRQNARTHREVEKLLKLLRDTAAKKPAVELP